MVTGVIEAKSGKSSYGTYGIMVGGKWYNSKYEVKANKGDEVEFDDGGKNYCNKLKVLSGGGGGATTAAPTAPRSATSYSRGKFPIPTDDGQRSIIRQNSLTNAVNFLASVMKYDGAIDHMDDAIATVVDVARVFESYSAGDLDREAAKKLLDAFNPED